MCYSNCKNENFNDDCSNNIDPYDTQLHCFEGFICKECKEIFRSTDDLDPVIDGVCVHCVSHKDVEYFEED